MTAPMPETMSPREKVLGQIAYEGWAQGLPGCEWDNQTATQKRAWSKASDAILAALASSGDHAELARLAEAASEMVAARDALTAHSSTWKRLDKATVAYHNAINSIEPATVLALIAEVAALRGDLEKSEADRIRGVDDRMSWTRRALEAERKLAEAEDYGKALAKEALGYRNKLAEAVGRQLPDISNDGPHKIDDHRYWLARQLLNSKLTADEAYSIVRHFPGISKEAERG
jgi:hypothetical protein